MRLLKENYDGLKKVNILSGSMKEFIKDFLSDPANQKLFKTNNLTALYIKASSNSHYLTELLISSDIDPLKYLDHIPQYFLAYTTVESIDIPDHIKEIGSNAFDGCTNLTSVTISNSVIDISDYAFPYCVSLKSIAIPDAVINIGNYAFYCCESLIDITIPDSVVSIGYGAFGYCSGLNDIKYTGTKEQWNKIELGKIWKKNSAIKIIHCTDGDIKL